MKSVRFIFCKKLCNLQICKELRGGKPDIFTLFIVLQDTSQNQKVNCGSLEKIKRADNGALIWKINTINAFGQTTQFSKGNGLITNKSYDPISHMPEAVITGTIQNTVYEFENTTGNLLSRTDNVHGNTEIFNYDNLNRLTQININGNIFNTVYNNIGNITNKTGVGAYSYDATKIHVVTQVIGNDYIPSQNQDITYTPFKKVNKITEGDNELNFIYGLSEQNNSDYIKKAGFQFGINAERMLGNHFAIGTGIDFCIYKYTLENIEYD